jgi:tRNA threonylcarbamoyl adenosine modification protein (Sua5/YciO/YrdC/YwlC family)
MTNPQSQVLARKVSPEDWKECGARLRNGDLVAFPTETVYGLGCHALDPLAVAKVFAAKERPLTDPLIVHVTSTSDAQRLWAATPTSAEGEALQILCDAFWPGPLTLVAKASSDVPPLVMANTGFVACRAPSHPLARKLIDAAEVPIAAPSANKFGHVSPTRAHHVWDDLQYEDVWIVDAPSVCEVGVESTVAKMEFDDSGNTGKITVLRQGAISGADLESSLLKAGLGDKITVVTSTRRATKEDVATVAPGQCYRHYSPDIPSFILSCHYQTTTSRTNLSTTVVIDFSRKLVSLKGATLAYRDLSASGDSSEAAQSVFETLRWAEQVEGATRILFPELQVTDQTDALILALKDRLTRAASGIIIDNLGKSAHYDPI